MDCLRDPVGGIYQILAGDDAIPGELSLLEYRRIVGRPSTAPLTVTALWRLVYLLDPTLAVFTPAVLSQVDSRGRPRFYGLDDTGNRLEVATTEQKLRYVRVNFIKPAVRHLQDRIKYLGSNDPATSTALAQLSAVLGSYFKH